MLVDDLILTKSLGKGSFGEVFLTQKKNSNEFYAAKRLDRAFSEKPENLKRLTKEITILKAISHPNIVKLIELKKTKSHIYIVTEYCNGGGLSDCLKKYITAHHRPFPEEVVQYIMKQVLEALSFLHSKKIVHRDLKLDNILVTFSNEEDKKSLNMMKAIVKIIDFGFATILRSANANLTYTVLGTPTNMEPHLLKNMETRTRNQQGYDEKADIWSLGTLCYEMLVGRMTFAGKTMEELYRKVEDGSYTLPVNSSKEAVSFINGMLQKDANKRLSAQELLKHDFIVKNIKDFQSIDTKQVVDKITGNKMNMNIKDNKTIWGIFNQDNNNKDIINDNNKVNNPKDINKKKDETPQQHKQVKEKHDSGKHHHHHHLDPNPNPVKYAKVTKMTPQNNNNYEIPQNNNNYEIPQNYYNNTNNNVYPMPEMGQGQGMEGYIWNQGGEQYIVNQGETNPQNQVDFIYQNDIYNYQ